MANPVTISALPAATTPDDADVFAVDQSGVTKKVNRAQVRGYKVLTGQISQSGTAAPTLLVFENTIGGTPTLSRADVGIYFVEITGLLTSGKTFATVQQSIAPFGAIATMDNDEGDYLVISTFNTTTGGYVDDALDKSSVEVRVYP